MNASPSVYEASLSLYLLGALLLFLVALLLIRRTQARRKAQADMLNLSQDGSSYAIETGSSEWQKAYTQWVNDFFLADTEPGRSFIRSGYSQNYLRYQVSNTSLVQGLGMFLFLATAGVDEQAQKRFEQLLAFSLAHTSSKNEAFSGCYCMPDVLTSINPEPDLQAEAWISFSLLQAQKQWGSGQRFTYSTLFEERLKALHEVMSKDEAEFYAPLFYEAFARVFYPDFWKKQLKQGQAWFYAQLDQVSELEKLKEPERFFATLLNLALFTLVSADGLRELPPIFAQRLPLLSRALMNNLQEGTELDLGISSLGALACCALASVAIGAEDLRAELIGSLKATKTKKADGLGATLRLLVLMADAGQLSFLQS